MVNVNDYYTSGTWIKAETLQGNETLVIASVEDVTYKDGKSGLLVKFNGTDRKLSLNKTNTKRIAYLHGDETEAWVGKPITLVKSVTEYQGAPVPCVRVLVDYDQQPVPAQPVQQPVVPQNYQAPAAPPQPSQQAGNFSPPQYRSSPGPVPNTEDGDPGWPDSEIPFNAG